MSKHTGIVSSCFKVRVVKIEVNTFLFRYVLYVSKFDKSFFLTLALLLCKFIGTEKSVNSLEAST